MKKDRETTRGEWWLCVYYMCAFAVLRETSTHIQRGLLVDKHTRERDLLLVYSDAVCFSCGVVESLCYRRVCYDCYNVTIYHTTTNMLYF